MNVRQIAQVAMIGAGLATAGVAADPPNLPGLVLPIGDLSDIRYPDDAAVADFDGDGILDVLATSANAAGTATKIHFFKGDGFGGFVAASPLPIGGGFSSRSLGVGDVDANGTLDVVLAAPTGSQTVKSYLGAGNGSFTAGASSVMTGAGEATRVSCGDLDGDGRADIGVAGTLGSRIALATSGGAFVPTGATLPAQTRVLLQDIAGSAACDVVFTNQSANQLAYAVSTGAGGITALVSMNVVAPLSPRASDVDGDGVTDLVACGAPGPMFGVVTLFTGTGTGSFALFGQATTTPAQPTAIAIGDLDEDGLRDAAVTSGTQNRLYVSRYTVTGPSAGHGVPGPPGFWQFVAEPAGTEPTGVELADFDGDQHLDVVMVCKLGRALVVARGNGTLQPELPQVHDGQPIGDEVFASDLDGDGDADLASLTDNGGPSLSQINVARSDGAGGFLFPLVSPLSVSVTKILGHGDVDGDSRDDVLLGAGAQIVIAQNDGFAGFFASVLLPAPVGATSVTYARFADLDGDQDQDVVATYAGPPSFMAVHNNLGASFASPVKHLLGQISGSASLATADVDADGLDDVVVGKAIGAGPYLLLSTGSGFNVTSLDLAGSSSALLRLVDVDADSLPDLLLRSTHTFGTAKNLGGGGFAATNFSPLPVTILPLEGDEGGIGDVDGDGVLDIALSDPMHSAILLGRGLSLTTPLTFSLEFAGQAPTHALIADLDNDGAGEIVTLGPWSDPFIPGHAFMILDETCAGQIGTHGAGCPGSGGFVPTLALQGCATAGGTVTLRVNRALGGSVGLLVTGLLPANLPIGGSGCSLFAAPLLPFSAMLPLSGGGPGNGSLTAPVPIPSTTAAGTIEIQALLADPSSAAGFTTTNGLTVRVQ